MTTYGTKRRSTALLDSNFRRASRLLVYAAFWVVDFTLIDHEANGALSPDAAFRVRALRAWICIFMMRRIDEPNREVLCLVRSVFFMMSLYRLLHIVCGLLLVRSDP